MKKIIFYALFLLSFSSVYAIDENPDIYNLRYAYCNEILSSPYIADMESLWDTKCLLVTSQKSSILFSQKDIYLDSTSLDQSVLDILKEKYYRGENLRVRLTYSKLSNISNPHSTLREEGLVSQISKIEWDYNISILEDEKFLQYDILPEYCSAESFIIHCSKESWEYGELQRKIDSIFEDIFLKWENLFSKDSQTLIKEKEKIISIQEQFKLLQDIYQDSQRILYTLELIDYKLSIYLSLINSTLETRDIEISLEKMFQQTKWYYQKHLDKDVFFYKWELFQYIYYKNSLVNTTKLDTTHFSQDEIEKYNISDNSKQAISPLLSQKYSLGKVPQDLFTDHILIYKDWYKWPTSILASTQWNRYIISGKPRNFQERWNYIYFESYTKNDNFFMIGRISWNSKVEELYRVQNNQEKITSYSFDQNTLRANIINKKGEREIIYIEL